MAKKPAPPPAQRPPSSSSSEEEEEDESSSDEEQTDVKKPAPPPAQRPPSSSSSEEEEEEEDSSSDEEQTNDIEPDPQKTLVKKEEPKSKSGESSDEEENDEDEDQKTLPVSSTPEKPETESEKIETPLKPIPEKSNGKSPFTRLWSLDDEITILEAMVDYQSKRGPIKMTARGVKDFYDSVRKSLSIDVGTGKLAVKLRALLRKYTDANKKGNKIKFVNPHSKTIYDLSKKVWGKEEEEEENGDDGDDDGFKVEALNGDCSGATMNKGKSLKREFPFIRDALGGNRLALEELEKVDVDKAAVLEKKFKKNKAEEINLITKAYKLVCKEAKKLMD